MAHLSIVSSLCIEKNQVLMKTSEAATAYSRKCAKQSKDIDSGPALVTGQPDGPGRVQNLSGGNNLLTESMDFIIKKPQVGFLFYLLLTM